MADAGQADRDPAQRLRDALGAEPPQGVLECLEDDRLAELAAALDAARRSQEAELADAGERALQQIPRLLRGAVRKVVMR